MPTIENEAMHAFTQRRDSTHGPAPEASAYRMVRYLQARFANIKTRYLVDYLNVGKTTEEEQTIYSSELGAQGSL